MNLANRIARIAGAVLLVLTLTACDSAEERAEAYYQSGLKYAAEGQIDKALVEFRNVFQLNGEHLAARLDYARLLTERENFEEATAQYLRVLEQAPDNAVALLAVARAMLRFQDFPEADRHSGKLLMLDPANIDALSVRATAWLRLGKQIEAVAVARGVLQRDPTNTGALLVLIADHMNSGRTEAALAEADKAILAAPGNLEIYLAKLAILEQQDRVPEITALLATLSGSFPDNESIRRARIGWMIKTGDDAQAERLLREIAAADPANVEAALNVVGLIERQRGVEAARVELAGLAAKAGPAQNAFRRALAVMQYRLDDSETAIASVRAIVESSTSETDRNESQVLLAFLLRETGAADESMALASAVLENDKGNVDALKLRARITIDADRYEDAIADLRNAQDAAPNDMAVYLLQSQAHRLNGSAELARDRLAVAVSVSQAAPQAALEYASALAEGGKWNIAESVLLESAQRHPGEHDVLVALAQARLAQQNWTGAEAVAQELRRLAGNGKDPAADNISVAVLQGQNRVEQSIGMLRAMLGSGDAAQNDTTLLNIIRTHVEAGEFSIAEQFLTETIVKSPDHYTASLLLAGLYAVTERLEQSEALYRQIMQRHPEKSGGYIMLARLMAALDRVEESQAVIDAGLANSADTARLEFMRAMELEAAGDFDGAIGIYDRLYEQTPGSDLLANNLASLLSEHRSDPESMTKAIAVSRRLRDSDYAPFQDTYGWILYLNGDFERALAVLNLAEEELGGNPIFLFHLGMTYSRLGQKDLALDLLEEAVRIVADAGQTLPQTDLAAAEIQKLLGATAN